MPRSFLARLSTAILIGIGLILTESCARESAPGQVMLLVSTNLSVPTDADTLRVTVTRDGAADSEQCYWLREFASGTTPVCQPATLPGTVAVVSKEGASRLAKVHLELRQGGAKGSVRVQRDAELQIPSEGVKQLAIPLDFLCLEANLHAACAPGTTCQAGSCVDDRVEQLADYVPTPSACTSETCCFNVTSCFGSINGGNSTPPQEDINLGCAIKGNTALDAVGVNVALIVNPTAVGNAGVCDATSGKCLIPLDHGPEGWTTLKDSNGVPVAIGLPEAVCAVPSNITGVVVSRSGQCGVKTASLPTCSASPICVDADGICPEGWSGSSCSGTTGPDGDPAGWCAQVQIDPIAGPVVPGLWCCGDSAPSLSNPLVIDDMSGGAAD